jgi:phosphate starvation-inducible PhoH-like protein
VPVDPYLLGILLGDGCIVEYSTPKFSTIDTQIVDEVAARIPAGLTIKYDGGCDYRISGQQHQDNILKNLLDQIGVLGLTGENKFVPDLYKFNTPEIRLEVLKGLLDTDGCAIKHRSGKCRVQFYSTSGRLAADVIEIVQSLGGIAHKRLRPYLKKSRKNGKWHLTGGEGKIWVIDLVMPVNPFRLQRKADVFAECGPVRTKRLIDKVEYIGDMDCRCIVVADPSHLYLTDGFAVTHNTFHNSFVICDEMQNSTPAQVRMVLTRIGENTKMVISGDVLQSDIPQMNGLQDAFQLLQGIEGLGFIEMTEDAIVRHPIIKAIERKYSDREVERASIRAQGGIRAQGLSPISMA